VNDSIARLVPAQTALLLMDFQPGIIGRIADPQMLLSRAREALETARDAGAHVGYVRVAFEDADLAAVPASNKAFSGIAKSGMAMHADAAETQIYAELAPRPNEIVVRKTRVGAFSTTDLDAQLRARGVTTLVLAGIATSGVVLSTLRDAADKDYRLLVLADATADGDSAVHDVLLTKVFPRQSDVISTADLRTLLV
jgi:nicotinamidase-related amidase